MRDDTNNIFTAKWQWQPTKPTRNAQGVTGWALCGDKVKRLHVSAKKPCSARYAPSKYGLYGPPTHVRLIEPAPVATTTTTTVALPALAAASEVASCGANDMPPPVIVTPTAASPEPSPGIAAPEAPAVAGTKAASEEVPRLDVVEAGSPPVLDSIAPAEIVPDEEPVASNIADKSAVAPPPPLPPLHREKLFPPRVGHIAPIDRRRALSASRGASCDSEGINRTARGGGARR